MTKRKDRFEFYKDTASKWRWRRFAPNGEQVGKSSQGYTTKWNCKQNAIRNGFIPD